MGLYAGAMAVQLLDYGQQRVDVAAAVGDEQDAFQTRNELISGACIGRG